MSVQPYIVAFGSYGGGGKTTLVHRLASSLGVSKISWDDYDEAGFMTHPNNWVAATPNDWKVPRLGADLGRLKLGQSITSPLDGSSIQPSSTILFDAPLGYAHEDTGRHIDCFVFIDTPLDVAMARRILRDYFADEETLTPEQTKRLKADLEGYLGFARAAFLNMDKTVKPLADFVVDGSLPLETIVKEITEKIISRRVV
jgi:uridine kinase